MIIVLLISRPIYDKSYIYLIFKIIILFYIMFINEYLYKASIYNSGVVAVEPIFKKVMLSFDCV